MSQNFHRVNLVHDFGLHLLWWSLRRVEVVCCVALLGTKAAQVGYTAALLQHFPLLNPHTDTHTQL